MHTTLKQQNPQFHDKDLRVYLLGDQCEIIQNIQLIESDIYRRFNITQPQFQHSCESTFKYDSQIQALIKEMKSQIESAVRGIPPKPTADIPKFLTKKKCS